MILAKIQHWFETKTDGEGNRLFSIKAIGELPKTCCPEAKTNVIDFDGVKDWYARKHGIVPIASVDGLYIDTVRKNIFFIEMKSWRDFLKYRPSASEVDIEKKAEQYDFQRKFRDSLLILVNISLSSEIVSEMTVIDREKIHTTPKHFVLLTDIGKILRNKPLQYFKATLNLLSLYSSKIHIIEEKTDVALSRLDAAHYIHTHLQPPVRLDCTNIDDFLQNCVK